MLQLLSPFYLFVYEVLLLAFIFTALRSLQRFGLLKTLRLDWVSVGRTLAHRKTWAVSLALLPFLLSWVYVNFIHEEDAGAVRPFNIVRVAGTRYLASTESVGASDLYTTRVDYDRALQGSSIP